MFCVGSVQSGIFITSLGTEGDGRYFDRLFVYLRFVVSHLTSLSPGGKGVLRDLIEAVSGDGFHFLPTLPIE